MRPWPVTAADTGVRELDVPLVTGDRCNRKSLDECWYVVVLEMFFFFFQAEDGIRDVAVTGVQTCALPIWAGVTLNVATSVGTVNARNPLGWGNSTSVRFIADRFALAKLFSANTNRQQWALLLASSLIQPRRNGPTGVSLRAFWTLIVTPTLRT